MSSERRRNLRYNGFGISKDTILGCICFDLTLSFINYDTTLINSTANTTKIFSYFSLLLLRSYEHYAVIMQDRTEQPNEAAVRKCISLPKLLEQVGEERQRLLGYPKFSHYIQELIRKDGKEGAQISLRF